MNQAEKINLLLQKHTAQFASVVNFDATEEKVISLDFTSKNLELSAEIINDIDLFCEYIIQKLAQKNAKYGIGGYMEHRTVYARSQHFDAKDEPRRLHLGVDIWAKALTPVYAFMDATIHSFAFNNHYGDYGATIILEHQLEEEIFYSLYGHLSLKNLAGLTKGQEIKKGFQFCDFGIPEENGHWPPHLHFQLMTDMENYEGDYPGVGKLSEMAQWFAKIPDANLLLNELV
ncbi:MAG: peptidoglycan DD-metalloendopeptidase family protein [Pelobium sp.]